MTLGPDTDPADAGDPFAALDSWSEKRPPTDHHPFDVDPLRLGRTGFAVAYNRLHEELSTLGNEEPKFGRPEVRRAITSRTMLALYELLEWSHSIHDLLRETRPDYRAKFPGETDHDYGRFVEGALGARNAVHHGLRRLAGYVEHRMPVVDGIYPFPPVVRHLRWVSSLPAQQEDNARFREAFNQHLAGTDVRTTFRIANAYFSRVIDGRDPAEPTLVSYMEAEPLPVDYGFVYEGTDFGR